jgi:hypothetical protein
VDARVFLRAETLLDMVDLPVAQKEIKIFWDAGLLRRRKGAGKGCWLYYWHEHPPTPVGIETTKHG